MLAVFATTAALATGLPPMDTVNVVDAHCTPSDQVQDRLRITYDRVSGVCAPPGPDGDPCSYWVDAHLPASALTVFRKGCSTPLPGRFKRDGTCGESPRWVWSGRLDAGHVHTVGPDGGGALAVVSVDGPPTTRDCLPESAVTHVISTPVEVSDPSPPQWIAFPASGYTVEGTGDNSRLHWTPGPTLRQWAGGDPTAAAISDTMPEAVAKAILADARTVPSGIEVRHQVAAHRVHFEGYRKRGIPYCERILEQDIEQRIRTVRPDLPLGPVMRITVVQRTPAEPRSCGD